TIGSAPPAGGVTGRAGPGGRLATKKARAPAARFPRLFGGPPTAAGNVYVADTSNDTIRKLTAAGVVTTLAGAALLAGFPPGSADGKGADARFNAPYGVAADSAGNVYVADTGNDTIRKTTAHGVVTTLAGPAGMAGSTDGTGAPARFNKPDGVAADSAGNIYVTDDGNHTVRKFPSAGLVTTLAGTAGVVGNADGTGTDARFNGL